MVCTSLYVLEFKVTLISSLFTSNLILPELQVRKIPEIKPEYTTNALRRFRGDCC